jgi:SAM-dependent methyltransferase
MKNNWLDYYKKVAGREPDSILKLVLENHITAKCVAYDMGCGAGDDTKYLLDNGFKVIAVDKEPSAIEFIKTTITENNNLTLQINSFEELSIAPCGLVFGRVSFPFCNPQYFNKFWNKLSLSLHKDGILCGTLFGDKDTWAQNKEMTFISHRDWAGLLKNFDILYFDEQEFDDITALGSKKHWHIYYFILKKIV